jgi:hypothetical protein
VARENGIHTEGSYSQIADGAAAVLIMSACSCGSDFLIANREES